MNGEHSVLLCPIHVTGNPCVCSQCFFNRSGFRDAFSKISLFQHFPKAPVSVYSDDPTVDLILCTVEPQSISRFKARRHSTVNSAFDSFFPHANGRDIFSFKSQFMMVHNHTGGRLQTFFFGWRHSGLEAACRISNLPLSGNYSDSLILAEAKIVSLS